MTAAHYNLPVRWKTQDSLITVNQLSNKLNIINSDP